MSGTAARLVAVLAVAGTALTGSAARAAPGDRCTDAAVSTKDTKSVSIVFGIVGDNRTIVESHLSDGTWRVALRSGTSVGAQVKFGIEIGKDSPLTADVGGKGLLNFTGGSEYAAGTKAEADRLVTFVHDLLDDPNLRADAQFAAQHLSATYTDDTGVDLSLDLGTPLGSGGFAGGTEAGTVVHSDGTQTRVFTVRASAGVKPAAPFVVTSAKIADLVATISFTIDPAKPGLRNATRVEVATTFGQPVERGGRLPKVNAKDLLGIPLKFSGTLGTSSTGTVNTLTSGLDLADPENLRIARALMFALSGAGFGDVDPIGLLTAGLAFNDRVQTSGTITDTVATVSTKSSGFALSASAGITIGFDFGESKQSTQLLEAYERVRPGFPLTTWKACADALKIVLKTVPCGLPGLGATMGDWLATHQADYANPYGAPDAMCPPGSPGTCRGGYPASFDPGTDGDVFQGVYDDGALAGNPNCPTRFLATFAADEGRLCRVEQFFVFLPHPVTYEAAQEVAASLLPAHTVWDGEGTTDPPLYRGTRCVTGMSGPLAVVPQLAARHGQVHVQYASGEHRLVTDLDAFLNLGTLAPERPAFDENRVTVIGMSLFSLPGCQ